MIEIISQFFIKRCKTHEKNKSRQIYGIVCSVCGIILNILMFVLKITAGIFSGSVAATVDAIHNLTDSASSVVSLLSFILSGQKKTEKYPMGKGRIEYVAGFIVSIVLISAGLELTKASVSKIITPESLTFSVFSVFLLILSFAIKIYMACFNFRTGKKISSETLKAAATDCLCDSISTLIALSAVVLIRFTTFNFDAWGGLIVSLFILSAGIKSAKDSIKMLMGSAPDKNTINKINDITKKFPQIKKTDNIFIHDYGPEHKLLTAEMFFCYDMTISEISEIAREAEKNITAETNCNTQIIIKSVNS